MKKKLFIFCVVFNIFLPTFSFAQAPLHDSIVTQLKLGVKGFMERYHSPSIVVAIVHDKHIIFSEALGYADVENKKAATVNARYPILSVSKTFTATMFMQLVQRKQVQLLDEVKKYIPEYPGLSDGLNRDGTTLFQLSTHSSGLPRNSPADIRFAKQIDHWIQDRHNLAALDPGKKNEVLKSLKFLRKEYPEYELMSYSDRHYSNLGYSLLGIALERAAKTDFSAYIKKNICAPLNMTQTGFDSEHYDDSFVARGYFYDDSLKQFFKTPVFKSNAAAPAGGMYSTATDLAKFISFQFENSNTANNILSLENRAMMQALKIGWKPAYPFVLHEGGMLGYRCQVIFHPGLKIGWVILTNTSEFEFSKMNDYFSKLILPVFNKKLIPDLARYEGVYRLEGGYDSLRIYVKDGKLYSSYLDGTLRNKQLVGTGDDDKFRCMVRNNYSISYDFISNETGGIQYLNMGQLMWVKVRR